MTSGNTLLMTNLILEIAFVVFLSTGLCIMYRYACQKKDNPIKMCRFLIIYVWLKALIARSINNQ
ncbi:hypothetical protein OIU79_030790 [Salix purpurea]|uniref:Uncharacterized protein n=1 Tax=Salix purpurea TaxID=77065 RepID=A0A9Q0ZS41_SALPP|nr:hypothetical protein OIU79_030790 [Salix purpurea]